MFLTDTVCRWTSVCSVTVQPGGLQPLIHYDPIDGLQAKFSLEYVVAAGLLDGRLGLSSFEDGSVTREPIRSLIARTTVRESPVPPEGSREWTDGYAVVEADSSTHGSLISRVDVPPGHAHLPLDDSELEHKFLDCMQCSGHDDGSPLYERLRSARDELDVTAMLSSIPLPATGTR